MNIEIHRRYDNTLVHEKGKPHGEGGALHEFLPYLPGKPTTIQVCGVDYNLEWDSDIHANGASIH